VSKLIPIRTLATLAVAAAIWSWGVPEQTQAQAQADQNDVLRHLNAAINWYKNLTVRAPAAMEPSDSIYVSNAETLGAQVVRLAFQSARAQAQLDSGNNANEGAAQKSSGTNEASQRYVQIENDVQQRIADDETKLAALNGGRLSREKSQEQQQAWEGKLELDKASLDAVRQMKNFAENTGGGSGLKGNIHELAGAVPEVLGPRMVSVPSTTFSTGKVAAEAAPKATATVRSGLFGQLIALYDGMQNIRATQQLLDEAENVEKIANGLRGPLRAELTDTLQQGKQLGTQAGATKNQYDAVTERFKDISAVLLPLSEEILVLDQSRANLLEWRTAQTMESRTMLISIVTRVALILISTGIVLGFAEVWRRLTFRYVRDPRRRRQFLIVRRFVMGFLIFLVVLLGFASEFSSLATFAGFVTAGIAVGLQTILLSVAAYFFVIGRYGISVGDRVSVAGVTGDVIDVGLVRFYLMEFAPAGPDLYPTGRIVVFSNAVLFQATTPLFKQVPGTRYSWHEAVLPVTPNADFDFVQKALDAAVSPVLKEYDVERAWQHRNVDAIELAVLPAAPEQRIQFAESGPELVARYPVDLNTAKDIDEKITRALIEAIRKNEKFAAAVSGSPRIRPAVKG
jgi:small-conductance mechanosensitive channel